MGAINEIWKEYGFSITRKQLRWRWYNSYLLGKMPLFWEHKSSQQAAVKRLNELTTPNLLRIASTVYEGRIVPLQLDKIPSGAYIFGKL